MTDPYNIEAQLEAYQERKREIAEVQSVLQGIPGAEQGVVTLLEYRDDIKYIRFLLESLRTEMAKGGKK